MRFTHLSPCVLVVAVACGGDAFTYAGAGGAASSASGSPPASQSASGVGGSGGSASVGTGAGGSGGAPSCGSGQYFSIASNACASCDHFDTFTFATPMKLSVGPGVNQGFPRVQVSQGASLLVYAFDVTASNTDIGVVMGGPPWSGGAAVTGSMINLSGRETAPLLLPDGVGFPGLSGGGMLLFDTDRTGKMKVWAAEGISGSLTPLPLPGVIDNSDGNDQNIAYAFEANPPRWYWQTDRTGILQALVMATGQSSTVTPVPITRPSGCIDQKPRGAWVSPKGDLLLFFGEALDAACASTSMRNELYYVLLDPTTGLPTGPAKPMVDVNAAVASPQLGLLTPSLSPDLCTLYFSAEGATGLDLYAAARH